MTDIEELEARLDKAVNQINQNFDYIAEDMERVFRALGFNGKPNMVSGS